MFQTLSYERINYEIGYIVINIKADMEQVRVKVLNCRKTNAA